MALRASLKASVVAKATSSTRSRQSTPSEAPRTTSQDRRTGSRLDAPHECAWPVLRRVARVGAIRSPLGVSRRAVLVRASAEEDPTAKLQEQLSEAVKLVQTKWEDTSDAEKPAAVAIIVGAVIAQIAIGATVDAVDRIPLIHQFLEFVGLAVTVVYAYRYFSDPAERDSVKRSLESFLAAVTGK